MDQPDEVSYSDFRQACIALENAARGLGRADPDEGVEHYLPLITRQVALLFSFVGSNMTARHVAKFHKTVAEYQAAKDVTPGAGAGTLPAEPTS